MRGVDVPVSLQSTLLSIYVSVCPQPTPGGMGLLNYITGYDFWRVDRLYGCSPWRELKDYKPFYAEETASEMSESDVTSDNK